MIIFIRKFPKKKKILELNNKYIKKIRIEKKKKITKKVKFFFWNYLLLYEIIIIDK